MGKWNGSTVCRKIAQKPVCNCLRTQYRLISTVYDKPCRYCEYDISTLTVLPVRNNLTEEQCERWCSEELFVCRLCTSTWAVELLYLATARC